VAAYDRLERDLHGQVEVVGEQGLDGLDHLPPVGLERVGGVVVVVAEERPDPPVDQAVEDQLDPRVVGHPVAAGEAGPEGAVKAVLEHPVIRDEIGGVIGAVGHHDRHRVSAEAVQAGPHREPEAAAVVGAVAVDPLVRLREALDHRARPIGAGVVDDQHLVVDAGAGESFGGAPHAGGDGAGLVVSRDHDRELHAGELTQRSTFTSWISCRIDSIPCVSVQSG
jgi:hypothetical protein